uniref:Adenylate cyclase type 9 n=1 Tax=Trichobilharzia regenti TaxID=157069 RepID=A0AA85KN39_TRIRE|nr:unnamed protein product [Trichobilharzia regenti]
MDSENNCDVSKRCKSGGKHKLKGFYLFERCSGGILNLKFDSDVLESFYYKCSYPSAKGRFRFGTAFSTFLSVVWLIYFSIVQPPSYLMYINGFTLGAVVSIAYFIMSFVDRIFRARAMCICSSHACIICLLSLFTFVPPEPGATLAFNLSLVLQLVLITYTMAPLRLWQLLALCGPVSILQIILASVRYGQVPGWFVLIFFVGHLCVHLIGINLHLMSQVWRRSTFLRMGYNALMRKALKKEQEIRDDMIRSLMPNQVAQEVMREVGNDSGIDSGNDNDNCNNNTDNNNDNSTLGKNKKYKKKSSKQSQHRRLKKQKLKNETDNMENDYLDSKGFKINGFSYMGDGEDSDEDDETQTSKKISVGSNCEQMTAGQDELEIGVGGTGGSSPRSSLVPKSTVLPARAVAFRKFHVNQLENVSVLFADIVGFTKMSSNKSASHLVYLLNDLFGRFDRLCEIVGCEKIATLGDCYYCVAGCPNPVDDHAERTVEMGRAMCLAIQQFDEDHSEQVNMRVGVHTGNVICGIVGTRRFKFDVWSNDVTLANEMESSGEAGKVHISEATLSFVKDIYEVSEGKPVQDIRKFKVLIEFFNKEEQCFAIKHTQDEAMIKTYFIERRLDNKPVVSLPPAQIEVESVSPQCDKVYTAGTNSSINLSNSQTINTVPVSLPPPTTSSSPTPDHQHPLMTKSDPVGVVSSGDNPSSNQLPQSSVDNKSLPMNTTITTTTTTTTTAITTNTVASTAATTVNTTPTANTTTLQSFIGRGSDVEMLQALQDFVQPDEVFIFPPISRLTLNFFVPIVEHSYRSLGLKRPKIHSIEKLSWSTPRIAPFINTITETILIIIIALTFLFISDLAAWAWCPRRRDNNAKLLTKKSQNRNDWRRIVIRLYGRLFRWKSRNIIGVFILILPTALILSCYSYCLFTSYTSTSVIRKWNTIYSPLLYATYRTQIGLLFTFMFINCTLYTSFSSWTKTISATFVCLLGILLIGLHKVIQSTCSSRHIQSWYPVMLNNFNVSDTNQIPVSLSSSSSSMSSPVYPLWLYTALSDSAISEYILIALLTLILVGMLNREFDINFRLSFHRDYEALRAKQAIGHQKLQADWLLENIIPYYIMNDLRQHNKYSQHIEDAGVVFACIANFSEFYDEQYQGGQEMLRVLNEIFADFEHQLAAPKYKDVEKIKTIGACFMAASGLNMTERKRNKQPDEHLWALLDFALDLIHTLDDFNRQMFNFQFELKVGYNIGEVTAGVIGTTKLLYDIWGDTVNVASRMYSTGLKGRIQVAETVAKRLESRYIFEYRGEVFVKGKGDMKTYLLVSRRNDKRDSK